MQPYDLERFVAAQEGAIEGAMEELRSGGKRRHWMWFVFPQIAGLGVSQTSAYYGIASLCEAKAYLAHPVLGPRLIECTQIVNALETDSAQSIFGSIDAMKFRSSMTLFAMAHGDGSVFEEALGKFFDSEPDALTLARI